MARISKETRALRESLDTIIQIAEEECIDVENLFKNVAHQIHSMILSFNSEQDLEEFLLESYIDCLDELELEK